MRNILKITIITLSLTSCVAYKNIDILYFNNPEKMFPDCSNGVIVLANYSVKNTQSKRLMYEWALDSVASAEAVREMQNIMQESPMLSNCSIITDNYYRNDTNNVILPIKWNVLEKISAKNQNARIIISLDYMKVTPKIDSYSIIHNNYMMNYGYLQMDVYYYWRVYNLDLKKTSNTFLKRDTLLWEKIDWDEVKPGYQLPGVFTAAAYSGIDAAKQYSEPYIAKWLSGCRQIFYKGNNKLEEAYNMAIKGEWINAAGVWQALQNSENKELAARAAFNLALASEMLDKFDLALEWLKKSYELYPLLEGIHEYQHILEDRIEANKH